MADLNGVIRALVDAFERGEKLAYTGHLVVTDPDSDSSVQMVLDEEDFAILKGAAIPKIDLSTLLPPISVDPDSDIGRLLLSRNLPTTSERHLVFGTRSMAKDVLALLPSGPVVLDCQHVSVVTPPFFHELCLAREDLLFEGMNEDVEESLRTAEERLNQ